MIKRKCKFEEADNIICELWENYYPTEHEIKLDGCQDTILVYDYRVLIPDTGYSIREGTYFNWDEEEQELYPDFSLSLIYDLDEKDPAKYLYWEQDGELVSLHNFLTIIDKNNMFKSLSDLDCTILFEEES